MLAVLVGLLFFVVGAGFIGGLRKIPADPPCIAAKTFFGKRTGKALKEGWHWFCPFIEGFIIVNITTKDQELAGQKVRTPDQAECLLPGKISWTPLPKYLINYLNNGEENGIRTKIHNIWEGVVREWAVASTEGPQTYMELLGAQEEAINLLLQSIAGDSLTPIPSKIPTSILLKYFKEPKKPPTESEAEDWGEKWEDLKTTLEEENPTSEAMQNLRDKVMQRRNEIASVRQGRGNFEKPEWGIEIRLLNIGQVEPLGELAKAMEMETKEKRDKATEKMANTNFLERLSELTAPAVGFSREQAAEIIQTVIIADSKVKKEINEWKFNLSPDTRELVEKIGASIIEGILKKETKNG